MKTKKVSRLVESKGCIAGIICPDGKRRRFYIQGFAPGGHFRGYVQEKGVSVSGYAKARGRGYHFFPHYYTKNIDLVRPETFPVNTLVRTAKGRVGVVVGVEWDYLTPTYTVRIKGQGRGNHKPVKVTGLESVIRM